MQLKRFHFKDIIYGQKRSELILYLVLWAMLYAASAFSVYISKVSSHTMVFDRQGLFNAWGLLTMFFVAFSVHNFLIAPQLVYCNRRWLYGILTIMLVVAFTSYQMLCRPHHPDDHMPLMLKSEGRMIERPPLPVDGDDMLWPLPDKEKHHDEPPHAFGGQDSVAFIIVSLLLALNVGAKYYFKSLDDCKRFHELERENLNTRLAYLKYQINPHFFMNTLNNIHALVLIDPEQANRMIETLSMLMRYVLYDGNQSLAPLQKEMAFVKNYVDLMRVRYTDNVRIEVEFPSIVPDVKVPSLLFATFIENAFKHGVSYERESFVEIKLAVDKQYVTFTCRNSRLSEKKELRGGVGLTNALKRMQLIYGNQYQFDINPLNNEYCITLKLPIQAANY